MSQPLGSEFASASIEDWMVLADKVVGDNDFEDVLVRHTAAHLRIDPLYHAGGNEIDDAAVGAPGSFPFTRGAATDNQGGRWDIRQRHDLIDPKIANAAILADLRGGVNSILLRPFGEVSAADLAEALEGVHLDMISVAFDAGPWVDALDDAWHALCASRRLDPGSVRKLRRTDPIAAMVRRGSAGSASLNTIAAAAASAPGRSVDGLVGVDATVWTDRGADEVQEVAWSLATGVSCLRLLVDAEGWPVDLAAQAIEFTYAAQSQQFTTMAKFRAARRCWSRIVSAAGGTAEAAAQRQHAMTPESLFTSVEPHTNLMRSSTAALAAIAAGAPSLTVLPFDVALGQPTELGRRTARNIQLLLQEEAHLGWVTDPGGGSWFIEDHTDNLARRAWEKFQQIEAQGGMIAALERGTVAAELAVRAAERQADERTRTRQWVGANNWIADSGVSEELRPDPWPIVPTGSIPIWRPGEVFAELRVRSASRLVTSALLVMYGSPAELSARSGWVTAALEAGGVGTALSNGLSEPDEAAAAWLAAPQSSAAVICAPDRELARLVPGVTRALRRAGCPRILVAVDPGDHRDLWEQAGVDDFMYDGVDLVQLVDQLGRPE